MMMMVVVVVVVVVRVFWGSATSDMQDGPHGSGRCLLPENTLCRARAHRGPGAKRVTSPIAAAMIN